MQHDSTGWIHLPWPLRDLASMISIRDIVHKEGCDYNNESLSSIRRVCTCGEYERIRSLESERARLVGMPEPKADESAVIATMKLTIDQVDMCMFGQLM